MSSGCPPGWIVATVHGEGNALLQIRYIGAVRQHAGSKTIVEFSGGSMLKLDESVAQICVAIETSLARLKNLEPLDG